MARPQKAAQAIPPDKGSFPLDHFGECKPHKQRYVACLSEHTMRADECKALSAVYLKCRMDAKLMAEEELGKLGFNSSKGAGGAVSPAEPDRSRQKKGFVAGTRGAPD